MRDYEKHGKLSHFFLGTLVFQCSIAFQAFPSPFVMSTSSVAGTISCSHCHNSRLVALRIYNSMLLVIVRSRTIFKLNFDSTKPCILHHPANYLRARERRTF